MRRPGGFVGFLAFFDNSPTETFDRSTCMQTRCGDGTAGACQSLPLRFFLSIAFYNSFSEPFLRQVGLVLFVGQQLDYPKSWAFHVRCTFRYLLCCGAGIVHFDPLHSPRTATMPSQPAAHPPRQVRLARVGKVRSPRGVAGQRRTRHQRLQAY